MLKPTIFAAIAATVIGFAVVQPTTAQAHGRHNGGQAMMCFSPNYGAWVRCYPTRRQLRRLKRRNWLRFQSRRAHIKWHRRKDRRDFGRVERRREQPARRDRRNRRNRN